VVYGLKILKWNLEGHQKQSRTVQSGSSPVHDLLVKALEVGPYILYLPFRQLDEANLFDTVFVSRAILAVKAKLLLA